MNPRLNYQQSAPAVFDAMLKLQATVNASALEPRLQELVKIRASQLNGCAFCLDMHTRAARKLGEDEQRLYQLDAWHDSRLYSERERAALAWTEAVTRISHESVNDALYQEARARFSEAELTQLTLAIIAINGWNRLNIAFRVPPG
jgi:AhpD family alkylhydroperoxidase